MRGERYHWRGYFWLWVVVVAAGARPIADDLTFRPTVLVQKGHAQGSGTVIASVEGETLVLTAAHVVRGPGPLKVELHRYNLGLGHAGSAGDWPRSVVAEVIAADVAADVAVLRIQGMTRLPFVAKLDEGDAEPARGTIVTSVGIDQGTHLSSWRTRVREVEWFGFEGSGEERPFLVTVKAPDHGRSGGGLFLENGSLVGVCVGRIEPGRHEQSGLFASSASLRQLLRDHDLDAAITRSEARHSVHRSQPSAELPAAP